MKRTSEEYENLDHFINDFPNSKKIRKCLIGAYNCTIEGLVIDGEKTRAMFLPTGSGKSDIARAIAIGLVSIRNVASGAYIFSPGLALQEQVAKDGVDECFERLGYNFNTNPFMTIYDFEGQRFRNNGCILESYTVQKLTNNGNVKILIQQSEELYKKTGKYPIAIFDECHLYSSDKTWGECVQALIDANIPVIMITGTPFRADNQRIPGFTFELVEESDEKNFVKKIKTDNPLYSEIKRGRAIDFKYRLKPDYGYSYIRAWREKIILKPIVRWVDATEITSEETLANMSKSDVARQLRAFLTNEKTVQESVAMTIKYIRLRKLTNPLCAAIVASLSDSEEGLVENLNETSANLHARQIKREFEKQAPDLKVAIITSTEPSYGDLSDFKNGTDDVLIVKAMGTIGFDCPRIKVVLNLSNYRTLPSFIQLINRGCRNFGGNAYFDVVLPKDKLMQALWFNFEGETDCFLTEQEITAEDTPQLQKNIQLEKIEKPDYSYKDYEESLTTTSERNEQEERVDWVDTKFPTFHKTMSIQEKLDFWENFHKVKQESSNFPNISVSSGIKLPMLDMNKQESLLRDEANSLIKEIINEIRYVWKIPFSQYGATSAMAWTCVKRLCKLPANQSLNKLSGIDNFSKICLSAKKLKHKLFSLREGEGNFNPTVWLKTVKLD